MSLSQAELLLALIFAFLVSDIWRVASVFLSRGFREDDEVVVFAKMVATAVLAGVVARILFFPPAELALIPLWVRLAAMAIGIAAFVLTKKSILLAILAGQVVLIGLGSMTAG
jgi:branched-subunit amino acid transport protein